MPNVACRDVSCIKKIFKFLQLYNIVYKDQVLQSILQCLEFCNHDVDTQEESRRKACEFDAVVGYLEDIIMNDDFQLIQRTFMEKHYQEFDDSEENKLVYTSIFNEYISLVEKHIEEKLLDRIPGFNMTAFTMSLQQHKDEMTGDIFDMLLTFTDFLAFKEMFLDYKAVTKESKLLSESGPLLPPPSPFGFVQMGAG
uniref:ADP-ribosylation factor-like protein 2-binding protein n=1 Tax=Bubo bubo TaxID=30461 RepID=A0A8C0ELS8_BUBBB